MLTARRSPGLRREELAGLAGISVDYLVQLEQGRAARPSAPVVASLARALRLGPDDAALLHVAAGLAPPTSPVDRTVPDSLERLLSRLDGWPVAVYSADWWLLRWNAPWAALLGDPAATLGQTAEAQGKRCRNSRESAVLKQARAVKEADLDAFLHPLRYSIVPQHVRKVPTPAIRPKRHTCRSAARFDDNRRSPITPGEFAMYYDM